MKQRRPTPRCAGAGIAVVLGLLAAGCGTTNTNTGGPGKAVFAGAGCGGCHTLSAAGAHGTVGPSLDGSKQSLSRVIEIVRKGTGGMPSYQRRLSEQQIRDVAAFVVRSAR